ncbi:MAG TPA: hypothetical protein VHM30_09615, partial [Gemmatimonadaceae bacterium]|nr:hypothetical protein [Gemmatimonadaceae bacterium]
LDLSAILHLPESSHGATVRRCVTVQEHGLAAALDHELIALAAPALERRERVRVSVAVCNVNRSVGTMLSGEITRRHGAAGLPDGCLTVRCAGSAGQSFGAFAAHGLTLELTGEANDYVGKGLSGGRLIVRAPRGVHYLPQGTAIVGNTVLYGATSGEAYFGGLAGQRFAVRNSGATAVVEGVGDHGCEYMTGGTVVVLGRTGRNFAAGMTGGLAFVLDESAHEEFARRCNTTLVELHAVESADDRALLRRLVEQHAHFTGSARARSLLARWEHAVHDFVAVVPKEQQRLRVARGSASEGQRHG